MQRSDLLNAPWRPLPNPRIATTDQKVRGLSLLGARCLRQQHDQAGRTDGRRPALLFLHANGESAQKGVCREFRVRGSA